MSVHPPRRFVSVGTKLAVVTLGLLAVVTALAYTSIRAYERANLLRAKEVGALMVGRLFTANVQAPLVFGDDKGVSEAVATLTTNVDVGFAGTWTVEAGRASTLLGEISPLSHFGPPDSLPAQIATWRTHDWVVVDAPVADPTGKVVGVSRIAFSLARENAAIAAMERKTLFLSLATCSALALVLIGLSRVLIVRPLDRLAGAARRLEAGEAAVIRVSSNDEVGLLASALDRMSTAIVTREQRIGERNRDMRRVLDNVEDGFLTVDRDGRLGDERSAAIDRWLGEPAEGATLFDYLGAASPDLRIYLELGWETVVEDVLPLDLAIDQLPHRFTHDGRHHEIHYRPLLEAARFVGMLVVIRDVTAQVERERAEAGQREMLALSRRLVGDRAAFDEFVDECGHLVRAIAEEGPTAAQPKVLARQIHTLKGNTALFGIESIAKRCHELEDRLADGEARDTDYQDLRVMWNQILERCAELGWSPGGKALVLQPEDVRALLEALRRGADLRVVSDIVANWSKEPAKNRLARLGEQITVLATRLDKPRPQILIAPTELRIPPKRWAGLLASLAHIVRNVADHGLETAEERLAAGKPLPSVVRLSLALERDEVTLEICDDGRGIDWEAVRTKAAAFGLPHDTADDLQAALFAEFSTRAEATELSGRGVGMGAVRAAVQALEGRITVESARGRGTTVRISLPRGALEPDERVPGRTTPPRAKAAPERMAS